MADEEDSAGLGPIQDVATARPLLVHVTTVDMSLELLLGPQLRGFIDAGYDVVAISAPGPYVPTLEAAGIRHLELPGASRSWSLRGDLVALWSLVRMFRELQPDVVHTHNPKPGVYGRIAARVARVPRIVNTVHGFYATPDDPRLKRAAVYAIERFAALFSDVELIQNEDDYLLMRDTLRVPARKLVRFGNGVDLARFDPDGVDAIVRGRSRVQMGAESEHEVVIGFVGRLVNEKGLPELIEAAEIVTARHPETRFALIGFHDPSRGDSVTTALIERAEAMGMRMLGPRDDVVDLYAGMDVFVLPSHREGFPRSVMEAAAMGVPTVTTDIRGCREAVDDGVTGTLVPVRDAKALADALIDLVADADRRRQFGANALILAQERFDVAHQIERSLAAYGNS